MGTKENENHLRSLLLLHYGGSYITKEIFHRELPKNGGDLDSLLSSPENVIKVKHEFTNRKQKEKLFPPTGQADINNWDIQMLTGTILILFRSTLKAEEKRSVRIIKSLRHQLAHSPTPDMEEDEFKDFKDRLCCAIAELASGFEISVIDHCAQLTKTYESCHLDATSYIEHLKELKETDGLFEQILQEIKKTKQSVSEDIKEATSEICETVKQACKVTVDTMVDQIQTANIGSRSVTSANIFEDIEARISGGENSKDFILLYQAKEKADVKDFHLKCDAKGPTLTILYGQHNTIFGGYTSKDWSSHKKWRVRDEDAFLFSKNDNINAECVFLPIKKSKAHGAITCDANFGPTFGCSSLFGEYDLQAFKKDSKRESDYHDDCMHLNGSLNINTAYGEESKRGEIRGQRKIRSKDVNSGTLLVKNIEVYQVLDDNLENAWLQKLEKKDFADKKRKLIEMSPIPGIDVKWYNILLVGVIGAGKSSFVNTLSALFSRKFVEIAQARDLATSVTNTVKAYILKSEHGDPLNIRIIDIRGFEGERGYDHELDLLLNGQLPVGYEFPAISEPVPVQNQSKRSLNDEMHLVCFVNGNFETYTREINRRINDIKKNVAKKGVPMVIVATKFDKLSRKIENTIDHIYRSRKAKTAAEQIANLYGVPLKHVFPVVNYVNETETVDEKDRLALKAIYEICQLIEASLDSHPDKAIKPDEWTERRKLFSSMETTEQKALYLRTIHENLVESENQKMHVLVVGPTNSGKSSFIDSIASALKGDIVNTAVRLYAASASDVSSTEKFQLHEIKWKQDDGTLLRSRVFFGDTPGFQEVEGITFDHVMFIMKGHVLNKYKIINGIQVTDRDFIADPLPCNRIHCVCIVFDCDSILKGLSGNMKRKMQMLLRVLQSEEKEFVVILTKCDVVSAAVKETKRRVFQERKVRECKDKLVEMFRIRQKIIFPVVNYTEENDVDLQSDALLMAAFTEILKVGKNKLDDIEEEVDAD